MEPPPDWLHPARAGMASDRYAWLPRFRWLKACHAFFRQPYVVVNDFTGTHANFGFGLFRLFHSVTFDQQNLKVRFENDASTIQVDSLFR